MWSSLSVSELIGEQSLFNARAVIASGTGVSILVAGPEGHGQAPLAMEVVIAYMCPHTEEGKACGKCSICGAFSRGNSGDFLHVMPVGRSRIIKVEQITFRGEHEYFPITEFLRVRPVSAFRKVVLISDADRMSSAASNSLLKMLEEPPEWARFVLTTNALSQLQATIRSRCLLISCEQTTVDVPISALVLSSGAPEDAVRLSKDEYSNFTQPFYEWLLRLPVRSKNEALKVSEEFQIFSEVYRECAGIAKEETRTANASTMAILAAGVGSLIRSGNYEWVPVLERVIDAHNAVQANVRFPYICDSIFVNWPH